MSARIQPIPVAAPATFADDFTGTFQRVRGALTELLVGTGADPGRPQDMSRRFGLDKSLTWKISKLVNTTDGVPPIQHLPGRTGMRIFLDALRDHGAAASASAAVEDALDAFDTMVKRHAGSRASLEPMLRALVPGAASHDRVEHDRKITFNGNSATWGVRARAQLGLFILGANADDDGMADLATIGGLVDFCRLRPDVRWPLFQREMWHDGETGDVPQEFAREEPIDPEGAAAFAAPIIRAFSSDPSLELEIVDAQGSRRYDLPRGPVGHTSALTCLYGAWSRRAGPIAGGADSRSIDVALNVNTPVEVLQLDLLVHERYDWAEAPQPSLHSRMDGSSMDVMALRDRSRMPMTESVLSLGRERTALATPYFPEYPRLVDLALERGGFAADAFQAFRVTMKFPPIPTAVMLQLALPSG